MSDPTNKDVRIAYLEQCLTELARDVAKGTAGKIHAIKAHRAATGAMLKDSKDWVEALAVAEEIRNAPTVAERFARLETRLDLIEGRFEDIEK
jgi:ribosomal protein L7/L12